jgi:hypothetical protein
MYSTKLHEKIRIYKAELISDITKFVIENAKLKIGDVVQIKKDLILDKPNYYVITQLGFKENHGISYMGKKLVKSRCEVNFMYMWAGMLLDEDYIKKATFKFKGKDVERIEENDNFDSIRINVKM